MVEDRRILGKRESRGTIQRAESRGFSVDAENRSILVQAENRGVLVERSRHGHVAYRGLTLFPPLVVDPDIFYPPIGLRTIDALVEIVTYTDDDTFYEPTVGGANELVPDLFTNVNLFYDHLTTLVGADQDLTPDLFAASNTFYTQVVANALDLQPPLFVDADTFFVPSADTIANIAPSLFTNAAVFYSGGVSPLELTPALFVNDAVFFTSTVAPVVFDIVPTLYVDDDTFYVPTIAATNALAPNLFTGASTFYSPKISDFNLLAPLLTNTSAFYSAVVGAGTASQWPDATNTGVPAGTILTAYSGPSTITIAGTVVDSKTINITLRVSAANVVIQNCMIIADSFYGIGANGAANITVQNCTIVGNGVSSDNGILGSGTFLSNNISGFENGITLQDGASTVKGNYVHDLAGGSSGSPHYDGIELHGGQSGVLIEGNNVINNHEFTSAVFIKNDTGPITNVMVRGNRLVGGGYTVYADNRGSGGALTGISFINNSIGGGFYGYSLLTAPVTWSGNIDYITGAIIP